MSRRQQLTAARVSKWLWERDGKPQGRELGESHRGTYLSWTEDVFEAVRALGGTVVYYDADYRASKQAKP